LDSCGLDPGSHETEDDPGPKTCEAQQVEDDRLFCFLIAIAQVIDDKFFLDSISIST